MTEEEQLALALQMSMSAEDMQPMETDVPGGSEQVLKYCIFNHLITFICLWFKGSSCTHLWGGGVHCFLIK